MLTPLMLLPQVWHDPAIPGLIPDVSMTAAPYSDRSSPDCSCSTMQRPISQDAAVMAAFTERAAESLAASMILETGPVSPDLEVELRQ